MALQPYEGLPSPLREEDVDEAFVTMVSSNLGTIPIQSQHIGNCASDSIQIVLFFADSIGKSYRQQAIELYNQYGAVVFDYRPSEASMEDLYEAYRINSIQRFLKLVASLHQKAVALGPGSLTSTLVRRMPSNRNESAEAYGKHQEYGVECSLIIGKIGIAIGRVNQSLRGLKASYNYTPDVYNPLKQYLLSKVTGGRAEMIVGTGNLARDRDLVLNGAGFPGQPRHFVGVQLFVNEDRLNGYFHTFTLIKINGGWYIGDNEVGLLSARTNFTDADILNNTIRMDSLIDATRPERIHTRRYGFAGQTITVEYIGTETGVPYTNAIETAYVYPGGRTKWAVRTYFVFTPDAPPRPFARAAPNDGPRPMDINETRGGPIGAGAGPGPRYGGGRRKTKKQSKSRRR